MVTMSNAGASEWGTGSDGTNLNSRDQLLSYPKGRNSNAGNASPNAQVTFCYSRPCLPSMPLDAVVLVPDATNHCVHSVPCCKMWYEKSSGVMQGRMAGDGRQPVLQMYDSAAENGQSATQRSSSNGPLVSLDSHSHFTCSFLILYGPFAS